MQKSLKQIIYETSVLVDAHIQLRSFHYGDLLDIIKKGKIDYASCFLSINNATNNPFFETITMELFVFDILAEDDSNKDDVENTTKRILNDLISTIRYSNRWNNFSEVLADIPEPKYYDNLQDRLSGWGGTIQLKVYSKDCLVGLPIDGYDFDQQGDFEATVRAFVRNTDNDLLATKFVSDSDDTIVIPNITLTDSDGTVTSEPSGVNLVCTPQEVMTVDFTADKVEVEIGEDVTFTDATTESPTEWAWDFGDSTTSDLQNPVKSWATAGTFDIRLLAAKMGLGGFAKKLAYITVNNLFRPTDLAGTQLYFAKNTATPSLWNDQSPNGYDLSQATAIQQPTIGTDTVDFDGVNDVLFRNVADPFIADTQGVIFFSINFTLGVAQEIFSTAESTTDNNGFRLVASGTSNKLLILVRVAAVNNIITLDTTALVDGYNYGYIGSNGTTFFGKLNGVTQTINATIDNGDWFDSVPNQNNITIGGWLRLTPIFNATKVNKFYYTNILPSPTDMAKLETFFSLPTNY